MKLYQAFAATTLLVFGYLALEAKAASLEQFRYDFDDQDDAADEQEAEASNAGSAATRSKREDDYGSPYGQELEDRYKRSEEESYDFTDGNMDVDNGYKRAVDKRYVDDYEVEAARSLLEPTPDIVHSNFNNRREPQIPAREEAVRDRRSYDSDSDEYNYDEYYSAETSSDEDEKSCESTTATPDSDYNDDDDFEDASPIPQPEESERTEASPSPVEEPEAAPPKDVEVLYDAPSFLAEATLETPPSPSEGIMIYPVSSDELPVESELSRLRAAPRNQEVEAGQEYRIAGSVYLEAASDENDLNARKKRATGGLEEYQRKFLQMFNELRARHGMPALVLDPALTSAAQAWAENQAQNLEKKHSCTECTQYAELLAKRRSPRPIPQGIEAAQWVYDSWFVDEDGNDDETYDVIYQNPNFHKLGVGMASRRAPDRSYHAYAVLRVSI